MVETQLQPTRAGPSSDGKMLGGGTHGDAPLTIDSLPSKSSAGPRNQLALDTFSPVNENGSFEFDRVIKSGYMQKRTQKTKVRGLFSRADSFTRSAQRSLTWVCADV